jgi:hypothetical protein
MNLIVKIIIVFNRISNKKTNVRLFVNLFFLALVLRDKREKKGE